MGLPISAASTITSRTLKTSSFKGLIIIPYKHLVFRLVGHICQISSEKKKSARFRKTERRRARAPKTQSSSLFCPPPPTASAPAAKLALSART